MRFTTKTAAMILSICGMGLGATGLASADAAPTDLHDALAQDGVTAAELEAVGRWEPEAGDAIAFTVLRKGKPFGRHEVRFDEADDGALLVSTDVSLRAGMGPITVYRYTLDSAETWRDGQLVGLAGDLKVEGRTGRVEAAAEGDTLVVDGTEFSGTVPLGILPSSHWNVLQTQAEQLVSTEDGEIIEVVMSQVGREMIEAGGESIEATRYLMGSDIDVDLWYDDEGRWVKLAFEVRDQSIEYVLDRLY
ncbi:MAG: DUF6134 family protein [Pseudomonadota bacterium]